MAFGRKEQTEQLSSMQDDKSFTGFSGQNKVLISQSYTQKKDVDLINKYLENGWEVKRVDSDHQGTMYYLLEKE